MMFQRYHLSTIGVVAFAAFVLCGLTMQVLVTLQQPAMTATVTSTKTQMTKRKLLEDEATPTPTPTLTLTPTLSTSFPPGPSFADTFPDRNLVNDLMGLSDDINYVRKESPSSSSFSHPKFEEVLYMEAELSTDLMIVKTKNNDEGDETEFPPMPPIVVYRGSESLDDWEVNFNLDLKPSRFENAPEGVLVHDGFQSALFDQDVISKVEDTVLELINGTSGEVILTGFSLGGANAHITAAYLADKYPDLNITMINFGAPRVGNVNFKSWTEESLPNLSSWRYVYRADIIPRAIPIEWGYAHAGHLVAINRFCTKAYYRQRGEEVDEEDDDEGGHEKAGGYKGAPLSWYYGSSAFDHLPWFYRKFFMKNMNEDKYWPTEFEKENGMWA